VDVTIEVKWTKKDIEDMLREKMREEGMLAIPDPKKGQLSDNGEPVSSFVWPKKGGVLVRTYAAPDPDFQPPERARHLAPQEDPETELETEPEETEPEADDDPPFDADMFPDGADVDALAQIDRAARAEARGKASRSFHPGESKERPSRK